MKKILSILGIIILMNGCNLNEENPEQKMIIKNEIPETTKPLTEDAVSNLTSYENGILTFNKEIDTETMAIGDIIVDDMSLAAPNGILRKVTYISSDNKTIYTEPATLEDAIENCEVEFSNELTPSDIRSINLERGVSSRSISNDYDFDLDIEDLVLYDVDGNTYTTNDQIVVNGKFSFNLDIDTSFKIKDFKLEEFNFENKMNEQLELEVTSEMSMPYKNKEIKLAEYNFSPFVATMIPSIPPLPIVITPKLEVYINFDGEFNSSIIIKIAQDTELACGINYENSQWSPISDFENNFDFSEEELTANAAAKASVGIRLKMLLYGVAGPYGDVSEYVRVEADINENPWLSLYAGLEAKIGVDVTVLGRTLADYSKTVISQEKILIELEEPIAAPSNLEAEVTYYNDAYARVFLSWNAPEDTSNILGYRIYRRKYQNWSYDKTVYTPSNDILLSWGEELEYFIVSIDYDLNESSPTNTITVSVNKPEPVIEEPDEENEIIFEYIIGNIGPAGGRIFYIDKANEFEWNYLEVAPIETEWIGKEWGGYGIFIGGTSTELGTGKSNTNIIVESLSEESNIAAQLCDQLVYGGYNDWFLPSKDELEALYYSLYIMPENDYWSSSEYSSSYTWVGDFYWWGNSNYVKKDRWEYVRAIRSF